MNRVRADVALHLGMRIEQPADLRPARTRNWSAVVWRCQSNRVMKPDPVTLGEVFQDHRRQLTIGNGHHRSIQRPDTRRTNADIFDRSKELAHLAHVPHVDRLVRNHHDAAEQVLNRFLRAEANGHAADAQPGERGREIDIRQDTGEPDTATITLAAFKQAVDQAHQRRVSRPMDSVAGA